MLQIPLDAALLTAFASLLIYVIVTIAYRVFFHPLANFSGPLIGKFSNILTYQAIFNNRRALMHYEYLQKYGSPVRISTNELVFSDMQSWADIYGQSSNPCLKDPAVYNMFSVTGAVNVANAVDRGQHSRLRRLLANGFAERELLISEPHIAAKVNHFIETTFLRNAAGQPIEVYHRIHELYLDIVSELSFGKSFDTLKGENPTAFDDVKAFLTVVPAVSFFHFLRYLPIPAIREGLRGLKRLESFSQSCVSRFQNDLRNKNILERPSGFLKNLCLAKDPETGSSLAFDELVENAIIFIVAGSGTTSITTTYLLWHVLKNPVIHKKLVAEIRSNFSDPTMVPTYEEVSKLVSHRLPKTRSPPSLTKSFYLLALPRSYY